MKLIRLALGNFKGCKSLEIEPAGDNLSIYGDNAVGKTTVADAWFWLLFGKDSQNATDFEIKTLGRDGRPVHHLNHSVSGTLLDASGAKIELTRTYKEDWVKTRGQTKQEFKGHTTDYAINGVPVQKKEYDAKIGSICDEKLFRLLSDPLYFNTQLKWQDRRVQLFKFADNITEAEVIASNPSLSDLASLKGEHSVEDFRKILKARRPKIAEEIGNIPVRIEELSKMIGSAGSPVDTQSLEAERTALTEKRARINAGGQVAELLKLQAEIDAELQAIKTRVASSGADVYEKARQGFRTADSAFEAAKSSVVALETQIALDRGAIETLDSRLQVLRENFKVENAKVFEFTGEDSCAACGQSLPTDKVEAARAAAEERFNVEKSERLTANRVEGQSTKEKRDQIEARIAQKESDLAAQKEVLARLEADLRDAKAHMDAMAAPTVNVEDDPEYKAKSEQRASLVSQIAELRMSSTQALADVDSKLMDVAAKIRSAEQVNAQIAEAKRAEARIAELGETEKQLAGELEKIDHQLWMTDEFVKAQVGLLEGSINAKFKLAKFKLFDVQINGAVVETCETTFNGVPYDSLNHGSRINVGLDIINTLAEHYDFAPPIFIDNAESVTALLPTTGQQIRLVVSEADKTLRVVNESPVQKELQLV